MPRYPITEEGWDNVSKGLKELYPSPQDVEQALVNCRAAMAPGTELREAVEIALATALGLRASGPPVHYCPYCDCYPCCCNLDPDDTPDDEKHDYDPEPHERTQEQDWR